MKTITEKLSDLGYKNKKMYHLHDSPHGEKQKNAEVVFIQGYGLYFPKVNKKRLIMLKKLEIMYLFLCIHVI